MSTPILSVYDAQGNKIPIPAVKGDTGNGISSISKTGTVGNVDTYTITFTNGTTITYTVTNADASALALTNKKLRYLTELTKGQGWDTEDGTTPAYSHTVAAGAKCVAVNMIGGKTEVVDSSLVSADVTGVDSKDSDSVSLGSLTIPQALRTAYPLRSAGTFYDEYDIQRKKFVRRVGVYTITGNESITTIESMNVAMRFWLYAENASDMSAVTGSSGQITCNKLTPSAGYSNVEANTIAHSYSGGESIYPRSLVIKLPISVGTTEAAIRAWLTENTPIVYYPLKTPVETDISQYFTDDNLLTVEAGGTLTFTQSGTTMTIPNGTEYSIKQEAT